MKKLWMKSRGLCRPRCRRRHQTPSRPSRPSRSETGEESGLGSFALLGFANPVSYRTLTVPFRDQGRPMRRIVVGLALVFLLAAIASLVTRWVVVPVRQAAHGAQRLSTGNLSERMAVRGADDVAARRKVFARYQSYFSVPNEI